MVLPATLDPTSPLHNSIGALYIGIMASSILHGVCLLQAFLYFQTYRHDSWYIKAAVITSVSFDAIHLFLAATGVYSYVITNYHNPSNLQNTYSPAMIEAIFVGGNGCMVQVFYTYRIWKLSKRNSVLASSILLLICGELATGMAWATLAIQMKTFRDLLRISPLAIATNVLSCSVDILIAGCLCIHLHRARTGFKRTDSIINKLILFGVSTGLLTTIFAILVCIWLFASPNSLIYGGLYLCISPLYTNSFLSTLNSRSAFSSQMNEAELKTTPQGTAANSARINIRIDTIQEAVRDAAQANGEPTLTKSQFDSDEDFLARKSHV